MSLFSIILTAGGIGKRMGGKLPKQFIEVAGKPLLLHTLEQFRAFDEHAQLIVTLPTEWQGYWQELMEKYANKVEHMVVDGGAERYHSIKNALQSCNGEFVAVHDGVRPLVSRETIQRCFDAVKIYHQVIPVLPVKESLRKIHSEGVSAVNRAEYCLVQTPQCFKKESLMHAYEIPFHAGITDDATLVEEAGYAIHVVNGNEENIKITTQTDLVIAHYFLENQKNLKK
jgi:2-C-methyl-D-erythritol 4-phosphate cytidylyltransferase